MSDLPEEFFGSVDFKGERFRQGNLPVDLLENVKAYQELLLDLAEEIWREKNPERQRLPKNFRRNLSLSFSHVDDGSAIAVLKPDISVSSLPLPDEYAVNYMALAQTRFLEVSRAANENREIGGVPTKARKPLKSLLSSLQADESLEIASLNGRDTRHPRVRFSSKTRDALLAGTADDRQKRVEGLGIVRSILDASEEIEILSEFGSFKITVGRAELRDNQFPIASFCEFRVLAVLRANGMIKSVVSQEQVEIVDLNDECRRVRSRIEEFEGYGERWKNGVGKRMSNQALTFAYDLSGFVCGIYRDVSVFPQVDGSITFEFSRGELDVEISCREKYVKVEVFDSDMEILNEQVFFGLSPRLLASISDIEEFSE